jgi:putative addiction module component (TIGR02574 family)
MDFAATLAEIRSMSPEERIQLIQAIWDTIAEDQSQLDLSDAQKKDLTRRIAELDADPNNVLTWEQIKAHVKRQ